MAQSAAEDPPTHKENGPDCYKHDRKWYTERFQDQRLNQVMTLKNGKQISFAEVGPEGGIPVFIFPGLGGSRQFLVLFEKQAHDNGLHLISPDRPGTGLSDEADGDEQKQPLAWPDMVVEIADHLKVKKFGLMGQSCGCVYALACAVKIPERIMGEIYLMSPWIPLSVPGTKGAFKMAQYVPGFIVGASSNIMSSFPTVLSSMGSVGLMAKGWSEDERKYFDEAFFEVYFQMSKSENRSGNKTAVMVCMEKYGSWGFRYEDAQSPCHIFHGDKDSMVPIAAAEWLAKAMPNCKLTVFPEATHNALMDLGKLESTLKGLGDCLRDVSSDIKFWVM